MAYEKNCLFCRFVKTREKDRQMLYEDNLIYVMLDDFPISRGHTLVMTKEHISDISLGGLTLGGVLGETSALAARALKKSLNPEKIYIASFNEEIQHLHFHLIPRYEIDRKGFDHLNSKRGKLENYEEIFTSIKKFI